MRKEFMVQDSGLDGIPVRPNSFPAKLWRLVNDPHFYSVSWDASGLGLIVDQAAFEVEVLRPVSKQKMFHTTNFSSFIRQLNLYGFKKVAAWLGDCGTPREINVALTQGSQQCFFSPSFKRGHPELLLNLRRLTSSNRTKMEAAQEVIRPPNLLWEAEKNGLVPAGPAPLGSLHGSSAPQFSWIMGPCVSSPPSACFMDQGIVFPGIPILAIQPVSPWPVLYPPTAVGIQPGPQVVAPPAPRFYQPAVSPEITGSAHQPPLFQPCNDDQPRSSLDPEQPSSEEWLGQMMEEVLQEEFDINEAIQVFDAL